MVVAYFTYKNGVKVVRWNKAVNAGHYIGRSNRNVRWEEYNVNAQCAHCNAWADKQWMLKSYRKNLCMKIGDDAVTDIEAAAMIMHKPTREELSEIIHSSKEWVNFTLQNPNGIMGE